MYILFIYNLVLIIILYIIFLHLYLVLLLLKLMHELFINVRLNFMLKNYLPKYEN